MALKHARRDVLAFLSTGAGMALLGAAVFMLTNEPCPGMEFVTCVLGTPAATFAENWGYGSAVLGLLAGLASETMGGGES